MSDPKAKTVTFKSFVMLFFQEQMQELQREKRDIEAQQKFYKKNMEKLLPMKDKDVRKHLSNIPQLLEAYEDHLKIMRGEKILMPEDAAHE